jgi:hypothetical protein
MFNGLILVRREDNRSHQDDRGEAPALANRARDAFLSSFPASTSTARVAEQELAPRQLVAKRSGEPGCHDVVGPVPSVVLDETPTV